MQAQDHVPWQFVLNLAPSDGMVACDRSFETPEAAVVWLYSEAARLGTAWMASSTQVDTLSPGDVVPLASGTFGCPSGTAVGQIGRFAYAIGVLASRQQ
jgi:hypothetical protein